MDFGNYELNGFDGSTPLGFLGALGLLLVMTMRMPGKNPRLRWIYRGFWKPELSPQFTLDEIADAILEDRTIVCNSSVLMMRYPKKEKEGIKHFGGLRPPLSFFRKQLAEILPRSSRDSVDLVAALMCETVAEDLPEQKQLSTKDLERLGMADFDSGDSSRIVAQTTFDFTSRNTQFLDQIRLIGESLNKEAVLTSLVGTQTGAICDRTMDWSQARDKPGALFRQGTSLPNPTLVEWLMFRSLGLMPVFSQRGHAITTACSGRRKDGAFRWCIWEDFASLQSARSLLRVVFSATSTTSARAALGLTSSFEAALGKTADGYGGVFKPTQAL